MKQVMIVLFACAAAAVLQAQETRTFLATPDVGIVKAGELHVESIKGAPYSADATTESVQVLADGNRIVNRNSAFVARDSQGRTRNEMHGGAVSQFGVMSFTKGTNLIMLRDPTANVTYTLDTQSKIARKVSTGQVESSEMVKARATEKMEKVEAEHRALAGGQHVPDNARTESLGSQMIEGVLADGTRTTNTIPAGTIGNEKDLQIVNEVWIAQDLKAVVMSKRSDPRFGDVTFKLTNIQRAEPDPALFQVPADYQIVDQPMKGVVTINMRE